MTLYDVTIERTEQITYRVEADSPDEADAKAYEGDEVFSRLKGSETISVEELS